MFGLKNIKFVKELSDITPKTGWLKFSNLKSNPEKRDYYMSQIIGDNEFIREDMKLRKTVEEMLVKEFSDDIKKIKSYDFLVDSVVNRLKKGQIKDTELQDIKLKK